MINARISTDSFQNQKWVTTFKYQTVYITHFLTQLVQNYRFLEK
jgi:hypothetical protein